MAGADMATNAGVASLAYNQALMDSRNAENSLLRSYGFVSADASGNYTTEGAQSAFDPRTLFRDAAPTEEDVTKIVSGLKIGGTGKLADVMRAGGTAEADIIAGARSAGFGEDTGVTSGIVEQRKALAEKQTAQGVRAGKMEFLTGTAQALGGIGQAQLGLQQARLSDLAQAELSKALAATLPRVPNPTRRGRA